MTRGESKKDSKTKETTNTINDTTSKPTPKAGGAKEKQGQRKSKEIISSNIDTNTSNTPITQEQPTKQTSKKSTKKKTPQPETPMENQQEENKQPHIDKDIDKTIDLSMKQTIDKTVDKSMKQTIDKSMEQTGSSGGPAAPPKRKGRQGQRKAIVQYEDKLQIVQDFEDGIEAEQIAAKYGICTSYIYRIINSPDMKQIREARRQATTQTLYDMMAAHAQTIESITTKYLEAANDETRIAKSSLGTLFTTWGIIIDKQLKLEELRIKREELELRKLEAKKPVRNDTGLLSDFLEVIKEVRQ